MERIGLNIKAHKQTPLSDLDLGEFEFVVALTKGVRRVLLENYGVEKLKIRNVYVDDPFGNDVAQYMKCAFAISKRLAEVVAKGLDEKGFGKLAKAARSRDKGITDLEHTKTAEAQADAEVEEKSTFLHTDAVDFKEDGGSRVRFRARRVREIIAELSGKKGFYVGAELPPEFPGARRASDGFWYVPDPDRPGKFLRVKNGGAVPGVAR